MATVTKIARWEVGDRFGKKIESVLRCSVALTTEGADAADMPASAFGFTQINSVSCYRFTASSVNRAAAVFTNGSSVFFGALTEATDANRGIAADTTGTLYLNVHGIP